MPISVQRWFRVLLAAGALVVGTFASNILPDADSTRDIGSAVNRYANVYADNVDSPTVSTTSLTVGQNGTAVDGFFHTTTTLNPDSVNVSTSTSVTVTGAVSGDPCYATPWGDFSAPSSTIALTCSVTASDTATLTFTATSGTVDLTSSTYNVEVHSFE